MLRSHHEDCIILRVIACTNTYTNGVYMRIAACGREFVDLGFELPGVVSRSRIEAEP